MQAQAWDAAGHRQIADIAWTKLTPRTKREVSLILMGGDPRYRPTSNKDADTRDAFRKAAIFADAIKTDRETDYESIVSDMNARFFKDGPPDRTDREGDRCKTWHYYDTPLRDTEHHAVRPSNGLRALTLAREQLEDIEQAADKDRRMQCWWLYWVEHLTGDLHQPLHCACSYEFQPDGDAGGNLFYIEDPDHPGSRARLHAFWDAGISRAISREKDQGQSPSVEDVTERWLGDRSLTPSRAKVTDLMVDSWIQDGAKHAQKDVYSGIERNGTPGAEYMDHQVRLCRRLAMLAGSRLAAILNHALGG